MNRKAKCSRTDQKTGDKIHSAKRRDWNGFFEAMRGVKVPDDFLSPAERDQGRHDRDPFEGWVE